MKNKNHSKVFRCLWMLLVVALGVPRAGGDETNSGRLRYWRGNLHTHSLWSDGDDFPEMIADWYRSNGYHFLALSDHNVLSEGLRWMKVSAVASRGGDDVLAKYVSRFGRHWVETRDDSSPDDREVRIKPLDEFRHLVEERGRFMMIEAEEISDRSEGVPVHMNASNIAEQIDPQGGQTVREAMTNNLRAVREQAKRLGREILQHLNHPNFGYAITAEDIASVLEEQFFEVFNGHPAVGHQGDATHPGVERLWDIVNTIRIGELGAAPLYGVATDDSHNYHGKPGSHVGRGWVMVQARYLTPEHIIRAMRAGEFYASSGVTLKSIAFDGSAKELILEIDVQPGESYVTQIIGTRRKTDRTGTPRTAVEGKRFTKKYSDKIGEVLHETRAPIVRYKMTGEELYIRAVVTSDAEMVDPPVEGQKQQAWTQPIVTR